MKIHALGLWTMRLVLVVGAVVAGCMDKSDVASGCIFGLIASFVLLGESDE